MSQILLSSGETSTAKIMATLLKTEGYEVVLVSDLLETTERIRADDFSLLIMTVGPNWDPELSVARSARSDKPSMQIILVADKGDEATLASIEAFKPFACVKKPLKVQDLLHQVQVGVDFSGEASGNSLDLNLQLESFYRFDDFIAESPAMKSVCDMASRVAATEVPIVVAGEPGAGKTTLAQAIHAVSARKDGPLVVFECGTDDALETFVGTRARGGAAERADGGTLLVRGIDVLGLDVQKLLAKVHQEKQVTHPGDGGKGSADVRLIATSRVDLQKLEKEGRFDPGLYTALKTFLIRIPPLRSRPDDIMPLVLRLLRQQRGASAALPSLERDAADALKRYVWPGNVGEMEKVLVEAVARAKGETISLACLPRPVGPA